VSRSIWSLASRHVDQLGNSRYAGCMEQVSVAKLLRRLRTERGESLRSAARELGVDASYLSRIESGAKVPSVQLQQRASEHYEVKADVLYLAAGHVPPDVMTILREHPELLDKLRGEYGSGSAG
jgi:transcriptional regulator with XRE-family HTH domain